MYKNKTIYFYEILVHSLNPKKDGGLLIWCSQKVQEFCEKTGIATVRNTPQQNVDS